MDHKFLQILVPQYRETESTISFLLDSIDSQNGIDKSRIGVVICSDGGEYVLGSFLEKYPFDIRYAVCDHRGVSATRNSALLLSDADYVMFCDADDGFCNVFGMKSIFTNLENAEKSGSPIDILTSNFYVESCGDRWDLNLVNPDNAHIHGIVYRRDFLIEKCMYWYEGVWANEDCFFNLCAGFLSKNTKCLQFPYYCWKGNPDSVTHDPKYTIKTLHQLLRSNDGVVEMMELCGYDPKERAKTVFDVICKVYLDMNKPCWYENENAGYKDTMIETFRWYLEKRGNLCSLLSDGEKKDILNENRKSGHHYTNIESITFNDFINSIMGYGGKQEQ